MKNLPIDYKRKTSSVADIYSHLCSCQESFTQSLREKTKIEEYAQKIFDKAITFEAWHNKKLVGLLAVYLNDPDNKFDGYITNVSVDQEFLKQGIATQLIKNCIQYAQNKNIKTIRLEVSTKNNVAIKLYEKFSFKKENTENSNLIMIRQELEHKTKEKST